MFLDRCPPPLAPRCGLQVEVLLGSTSAISNLAFAPGGAGGGRPTLSSVRAGRVGFIRSRFVVSTRSDRAAIAVFGLCAVTTLALFFR
jgi:hypothetical protein